MQPVTLTVAEHVREYDATIHIMQPSPVVHFDNRELLDEEGHRYQIHLVSTEHSDAFPEGCVRYHIEFLPDVQILPGTVLHPPIPEWYQKLPACPLAEIIYSTSTTEILLNSSDDDLLKDHPNSKFHIYVDGKIHAEHYDWHTGEIDLSRKKTISAFKAKVLMGKMLHCVSDVSCHQDFMSDDTARCLCFRFTNGEVRSYSGVFYDERNNTSSLMWDLISGLFPRAASIPFRT